MHNPMENSFNKQPTPSREEIAYQKYLSDMNKRIEQERSQLSSEDLALLTRYEDVKKDFSSKISDLDLVDPRSAFYGSLLDELAALKPKKEYFESLVLENDHIQNFLQKKKAIEKEKITKEELLPHEIDTLVDAFEKEKEEELLYKIQHLEQEHRDLYELIKSTVSHLETEQKRRDKLDLKKILSTLSQQGILVQDFTEGDNRKLSRIQKNIQQQEQKLHDFLADAQGHDDLVFILRAQNIQI